MAEACRAKEGLQRQVGGGEPATSTAQAQLQYQGLASICWAWGGPGFQGVQGAVRALTQLVIPRIVRDLHGVDLEPSRALPQAVCAGDRGALLIHHLHQLGARKDRALHSPPPCPQPTPSDHAFPTAPSVLWGSTR